MSKSRRERVRVVLVGCGEHASVVIHPSIAFVENARMVACCDRDRSRAERTGSRYGIRPYLDLDEMLKKERADVAIVVTFPAVQSELVKKCLHAGLHVFTEKPLGVELDEIRDLRRIADSSKLLLSVGFMKRYNPSYLRMKEAVESSEFGAPSLFYAKFAGGNRPRTQDLFRVGSIHMFDLARFVVGELDTLFASKYEIADGQASIAVNGSFRNGCVASFLLSSLGTWTTKWAEYAEVLGNRNLFVVDNCRTCYWQKAPVITKGGGTTQMVKEEPLPAEYGEPNYSNMSELRFQAANRNGYLQLLENFITDVREGRQKTPNATDAEEALKIAVAVERSLETGTVMSVDDIGNG